MSGYFYIGFIDFMLKGKFCRNIPIYFLQENMKEKWQSNTKIFSLDSQKVKVKKIYCIVFGKHKKFKNPKKSHIFEETLVLSIVCSKCGSKN